MPRTDTPEVLLPDVNGAAGKVPSRPPDPTHLLRPDDPADVIDYLDALLEAPAVLLTGSPTTWRGF